MQEIRFKGVLIIPDTDIKTIEVIPNSGETVVQVPPVQRDIVIHSIYVSHQNPVMIKFTIKPTLQMTGKFLTYTGVFDNARGLKFDPPIGPFKDGKVSIKVEGTNADRPVYVAIQYSYEYGEERHEN